jgi:hypothetical protein
LDVEVQMHGIFARAITGGANPNNNHRQVFRDRSITDKIYRLITLLTGPSFEQVMSPNRFHSKHKTNTVTDFDQHPHSNRVQESVKL